MISTKMNTWMGADWPNILGIKTTIDDRSFAKTMRPILLLICLSFAVMAEPVQQSKSPAVPKEVRRTVELLEGHWTFQGTDTEPGKDEPATVSMEIDCKSAALGAAVACRLTGTVSGFGPVEAASVVGYDAEEKVVHWMEVSSTGEYHDHKGLWKKDRIVFEPLAYTAAGKKCTERFSLVFPAPNKMMLKSVTETEDGMSRIEGVAIRK